MKQKPIHTYEARAAVAKALAHPSRLMILEALRDGEQCVCEMTDIVQADQSTVSKHLAILRNAGLIEGRREGVMTFYRRTCVCIDDFFACVERILKQNLKRQQAAIGVELRR